MATLQRRAHRAEEEHARLKQTIERLELKIAEQVNAKQAELLDAVLIAAMGGPAQTQVGTGGGGSNDHSPWNDKDKKIGVKRG
ncbi:MAG: hypothetical protein KBT34_09545 [Prevotella sp.]|nr:hypothetical protein [Candidatus Prevotella equi]